MRALHIRRLLYRTGFFAVILIFFFLRLYRLYDRAIFHDDQGLDMIVVWSMEHLGLRPVAGALLSIGNISVPPYFYYILWFFYRLTGSLPGIYFGWLFISLISFLLITLTVYLIKDLRSALLSAFLIAISSLSVFMTHIIWDPVPGIAFLSLAILLLLLAYRKKLLILLWAAVLSYAISVSIYPGPVILLPLAFIAVYWWYRKTDRMPFFPSLALAILTLVLTFLLPFIPVIILESSHG